jgi:hypothetical protein
MKKWIYVLFHEVEGRDGSHKLIGVFETEAEAKGAVALIDKQPGFKDHKDGFLIDRYEVNKVHWTEGFGID